MSFETQTEPPPPGLQLSGRQIEVWHSLRSKAKEKFPFHDWYAGAVGALDAQHQMNPDRLAQAANSLREILEKLPQAVDTEIRGPDRNVLKQSRNAIATAMAEAKDHYAAGWTGEITPKLTEALDNLERYLQLAAAPTRAQRTFGGLVKLDPMMQALPGGLQQRKLQVYQQIAKTLEQFTHHRCRPDPKDFGDCLTQTEDLILDLLAPLTADDQNDLFAVISKGSAVTKDDIARALRLIERRGANFAFFFDNVDDPVWLEPLESAGYFKDPPDVTSTGEGMVTFPFWWPMAFLRRVASKAPERVVAILLKIDRTDNPRVLDGVLAIAAELPVELSIRLRGRIRAYISQPYHV